MSLDQSVRGYDNYGQLTKHEKHCVPDTEELVFWLVLFANSLQ